MNPVQLLEALLFAHGEQLEKHTLAQVLGVSNEELAGLAAELSAALNGRGIVLLETSDTYELRTHPDAFDILKKLRDLELSADLGRASLETLAIILYKKGATRREIDHIRGVNSSTALRTLLIRGLIDKGEFVGDKRQAFYTTTADALAHLGAMRVEELPDYATFSGALAGKSEPSEETSSEETV